MSCPSDKCCSSSPEQVRQGEPTLTANRPQEGCHNHQSSECYETLLNGLDKASHHLRGIREMHYTVGTYTSKGDNWRQTSKAFDICYEHGKPFVEALPGYCALNQNDRDVLIRDGLFGFAVLQFSLDYNTETGRANFFGLDDPSINNFVTGIQCGAGFPAVVTMAGPIIKNANLSDNEVKLLSALVFFNYEHPEVTDREKVREIAERYVRAAEQVLAKERGKEAVQARLEQLRGLARFCYEGEKLHAKQRAELAKELTLPVLKQANTHYYNFYQFDQLDL